MKVNYRWLKHLPDQNDRKEFESAILSDGLVLGRLLAIIEEMDQELDQEEMSPEQFDNPNWAFKRAYRSGDKYRIKELKELLKHLRDS